MLEEAVNLVGNEVKQNILVVEYDEKISPLALRRGTHFITTRESITLEVMDYLWDTNVKIVSALDENIFGG